MGNGAANGGTGRTPCRIAVNPIADPTGASANTNQECECLLHRRDRRRHGDSQLQHPDRQAAADPPAQRDLFSDPRAGRCGWGPDLDLGRTRGRRGAADPDAVEQFTRNRLPRHQRRHVALPRDEWSGDPAERVADPSGGEPLHGRHRAGGRANTRGEAGRLLAESFSIGSSSCSSPWPRGHARSASAAHAEPGPRSYVTATLTTVPEPSGLALFAGGALILRASASRPGSVAARSTEFLSVNSPEVVAPTPAGSPDLFRGSPIARASAG